MSVLSNRSLMHQMYCSRSYINTSLASSNCNQPARAGFCFKTFIQRAITACASALLTSQFALFLFFSDSKIKNQNPIPTVSFGFFLLYALFIFRSVHNIYKNKHKPKHKTQASRPLRENFSLLLYFSLHFFFFFA